MKDHGPPAPNHSWRSCDTQCPFDLDPIMYLSFDSNKRDQNGEKHGTHCAVY